ncbi:sugar transporter SWEET1-like isoform X2 [Pollicipes pollicipes]|uniref:sugar transporter SWEET1-like isoform X2 n=1 Tax=Pollicipes pollicipes TaxID=41117 RepID=UPI0018857BB9|nr:sugar transporter SWEET1-like isoform X2 [Pollicipes pollicipes]
MSSKAIISVTATVSTLCQFLTGVCSLWLKYGLLIGDPAMITVNFSGLVLQACYLAFYYRFCFGVVSLSAVRRQVLTVVALVSTAYWYMDVYEKDRALAQYRLGCAAATASIGFTAAPLASLAEVIRSKSTEVLPLPLIVATFAMMLQWFVYGVLIDDAFVQVPNLVGTFVSGFQLLLFVVYPRTRKQHVAAAVTRI